MQTTDHALDYRLFEGVLPEGGVGAGPVMVWDEGTYFPEIELPDKTREIVEGKKRRRSGNEEWATER